MTPCAGHTALWFSRDRDEIRAAKAICRTRPHRYPCLAGAIERDEPCGVWGGEDFNRLTRSGEWRRANRRAS
mgnify:CR=1 FL=1